MAMPGRRIVMSYQALNWKKVKKLSCKSVRDNIMSSNVFQWGTSENNANYTPLSVVFYRLTRSNSGTTLLGGGERKRASFSF